MAKESPLTKTAMTARQTRASTSGKIGRERIGLCPGVMARWTSIAFLTMLSRKTDTLFVSIVSSHHHLVTLLTEQMVHF